MFKPGLHHLDLRLFRVFLDVILDTVQGMGFETEDNDLRTAEPFDA